jgi:hypothetical protein
MARGNCTFHVYSCNACDRLDDDARDCFLCQDCAWQKHEMLECRSGDCMACTCRDCAFDASSSSDVRGDDGIRFCATWESCTRDRRGRAEPVCRRCFFEHERYSMYAACAGDGCVRLCCNRDPCRDEWMSCETCEESFCAACAQRYFRTAGAEQCNACAG